MATHASTTPGEETIRGEQFPLFDVGMNLSEVRSAGEKFLTYSKAVNTVKGYAYSFRVFERWCEEAGRQSLPASPDSVFLFVSWACETREVKGKRKPYKLTNVNHIMAAIQNRHRAAGFPLPVDARVRETLAGVARQTDQEPGGKDAMTPEQLRRALAAIEGDTPLAIRDRAILLVGFVTGWRSCELAALRFREIRFHDDRMVFHLRRSKTDQLGKGRQVLIPRVPGSELCPVRALEAWVKARGNAPGSLFLPFKGWRLEPEDGAIGARAICGVVKKALRRAGIDPVNHGAHSLRSGMVTAAAENGADVITIQERTGHKHLESIARYVRKAGGFRRDPLAGVLAKATA